MTMAGSTRKQKWTIKKMFGDDEFSWCLLSHGRPVLTGMDRREAQWERDTRRKNDKKEQR